MRPPGFRRFGVRHCGLPLLLVNLCSASFPQSALTIIHSGATLQPVGKLPSELRRRALDEPQEIQTVWVFFLDKNLGGENGRLQALRSLPDFRFDQSRRPARRFPPTEIDIQVAESYVEALRSCGARIRHLSRWLNAASIEAAGDELLRIASLPFVRELRAVGRRPIRPTEPHSDLPPRFLSRSAAVGGLPYGASHEQAAEIGVTALHELGYAGAGVRVLMCDTGFKTTHPAIRLLNIAAERDFVYRDDDVDPEPGDLPGEEAHGTATCSALGGWAPGEIVGPAYGATFLLARTEDARSELPFEEDNYIAALEWADSMSVDVVSASLAYLDYDGGVGYGERALDGKSIPVSIAVDIAVSRGIVVVNSAANAGPGPTTIRAPADAVHVISVGAVDPGLEVTWWSSRGPTADGRLKPEVVARGSEVYVADSSTDGYRRGAGTSFSGPLVGGCAALLVEAHPEWDAYRVREALMITAGRAHAPDNDYGHGLVNVFDAAHLDAPSPPRLPAPFVLLQPADGESVSVPVFRWTSARRITNAGVDYALVLASTAEFADAETILVGPDTLWAWPGAERSPLCRDLWWTVRATTTSGFSRTAIASRRVFVCGDGGLSGRPRVYAPGIVASPNPVGAAGAMTFRLHSSPGSAGLSLWRLTVHDLRGRAVRTLFGPECPAGDPRVTWDLRDDAGLRAAPGVYLVRWSFGSGSSSVKVTVMP